MPEKKLSRIPSEDVEKEKEKIKTSEKKRLKEKKEVNESNFNSYRDRKWKPKPGNEICDFCYHEFPKTDLYYDKTIELYYCKGCYVTRRGHKIWQKIK